jgi:prevent-host-death family protein
MKTASAREVQHEFSSYLTRASKGESVVITKHGRKMAQLVPIKSSSKAKPLAWPDFAARIKRHFPDGVPAGKAPSTLIAESREDRF